jgi:hypothetical protein
MEILNSPNNEELKSSKLYDLIDASYKPNLPAEELGYKHGYRIDKKLSNHEQKVFIDKDDNPTIVFTGSNKLRDWTHTNPALLLGLHHKTKRFQDAEKLTGEVRKKYKGELTAVGYSLGGKLAEHVKADKKITVNKGAGLGDFGRTIGANQTDIRTTSDPVSLLSKTQKHKGQYIEIKSKSTHPIEAHKYSHIKQLSNY